MPALSMRIAFLGLGRMGAPMAARLVRAGHAVTVWNRTVRPDAVPAGARLARDPADAVASAEYVITMLADDHALDAVIGGERGLLGHAPVGALLIDMSTIGPAAAGRVATRCAETGLRFIDAPVSGSVPAARAGTLLAMLGADPSDVEDAKGVLGAMTSRQLHLGPVGSGATMKLALNLMLAMTNEAIAETLALTDQAGIATAQAYEVLANSAVGSPYVGYKREAFVEPATAPVAFSVELMAKDVSLALALAADLKVSAPAGTSTASTLKRAIAAGLGTEDLSAVHRMLSGH